MIQFIAHSYSSRLITAKYPTRLPLWSTNSRVFAVLYNHEYLLNARALTLEDSGSQSVGPVLNDRIFLIHTVVYIFSQNPPFFREILDSVTSSGHQKCFKSNSQKKKITLWLNCSLLMSTMRPQSVRTGPKWNEMNWSLQSWTLCAPLAIDRITATTTFASQQRPALSIYKSSGETVSHLQDFLSLWPTPNICETEICC